MTNKIYIVTDLGPGDGGKGGVVHKICNMMSVHTVIKAGGGQGSHGVFTSAGQNFSFSHWGCGTFDGARTHISSRMVITPEGILNEADALRYQCGEHNPFSLLTIDERALCATPYHGIASRLKEMALGKNSRGTIGTGVGEAVRDLQRFPELAIRARDLSRDNLKAMVAAVREQIRRDLQALICGEFLPEDREMVAEEVSLLNDDAFLEYIVTRFREVSRLAKIVDPEYLGREVFSKDGPVVVEKSHGILTDHFHGFHPHTSAIRTLPCFEQAMLRESGFAGQIVNVGVFRGYSVRHGAGPMPTADEAMAETLLPGSSKQENRFQGKIRVGPLDLVLLRYAIEVCGGQNAFDGLAVTWFDQISANKNWHICRRYRGAENQTFFSPKGEIIVRQGTDAEQLVFQQRLGEQLKNCTPVIESCDVPPVGEREKTFSLCAGVLQEELGVPVRLVSFGRTEQDKLCK